MSDSFEIGGLYGYTGEEKDVISVAMSCRAENGGWCGASIARMAMPGKHLTQEELNRFARLFIAAGNAATACEAAGYDAMAVLESLPNVLEALKAAHFFISNGIELGYISPPTIPQDPGFTTPALVSGVYRALRKKEVG